MAAIDRERALHGDWARLTAEVADGELSANDIADRTRRKAELRAEMERLGIRPPPDAHDATTYRDPG